MTVVPGRITMALNLGGHYGPQVDVACGTVEPHVDRWEAGVEAPTDAQLLLLAQLTGQPISFFHRPMPDEVFTGYVCVRGGRGRGCHPFQVDYRPTTSVTPIHPDVAHHDGRLF